MAPVAVVAPSARVGKDELALLRAFRTHLGDSETTPGQEVGDFLELGRCPVRGVDRQIVDMVLAAHPESFTANHDGWAPRARLLTLGWSARGRVPVPDSPCIWIPTWAFSDHAPQDAVRAQHTLTWAQLAAQAWALLKSDHIKGTDILVWDAGFKRRILRVNVSLMCDDEPGWVAAVNARTELGKLMTGLRTSGWSFWPRPGATWIGRGEPPKWYTSHSSHEPTVDWSDERNLARHPESWTDVIATYRSASARVVLAATLGLIRDHLQLDPSRVELAPHFCTDAETQTRRRARLEARLHFFRVYDRVGWQRGGGHKPAPLAWCCVCGLGLSDPVSLARGMGDVCAGKVWDWAGTGRWITTPERFSWAARHGRTEPHLWAWAVPADTWRLSLVGNL